MKQNVIMLDVHVLAVNHDSISCTTAVARRWDPYNHVGASSNLASIQERPRTFDLLDVENEAPYL